MSGACPAWSHRIVTTAYQPFTEVGEHVDPLGRKVREEVPEVLFLMCVDAQADDLVARFLVQLGRSYRAQLEGVSTLHDGTLAHLG